MPSATRTAVRVLAPQEWRRAEAAHHDRADALLADHRRRAARGEPHPVEDFLFTYYSHRPAQLRRWHPGPGLFLRGATERASWRYYTRTADGVGVDLPQFLARRGDAVRHVQRLLGATAARTPHFGCFGLHEWAMVYRQDPAQVRHDAWPLRLTADETAAVVESQRVRCSHFDAFRFFTPAAAPRNELRPTRAAQDELEQPGCLHANMDLYKWSYKLTPLVPGELVLDCFELARDIRTLDMRASPYDLTGLGHPPVEIETAAGRAEYVAAQREFASRASVQRQRLLDLVSTVMVDAETAPPPRFGGSP